MPRPKSEDVQGKPPVSYIYLCAEAILRSPIGMATLSEIYEYITQNYPYYQKTPNKWQNSLRHNLSYNDCFVKVERKGGGKGNYWRLHDDAFRMFEEGSVQRRKKRFVAKNNPGKKASCNDSQQHQESLSASGMPLPHMYTQSDISPHETYMKCQLEESHHGSVEEAAKENAHPSLAGNNSLPHSIANILKPDSPKRKKRPVRDSPSPPNLVEHGSGGLSSSPDYTQIMANKSCKKLKSTPLVAPIPLKPVLHADNLSSLYHLPTHFNEWSSNAVVPDAIRSMASDQQALLMARAHLNAHQQHVALLSSPSDVPGLNSLQAPFYNQTLPFNHVNYFSGSHGYNNNSLKCKLDSQNFLLCR